MLINYFSCPAWRNKKHGTTKCETWVFVEFRHCLNPEKTQAVEPVGSMGSVSQRYRMERATLTVVFFGMFRQSISSVEAGFTACSHTVPCFFCSSDDVLWFLHAGGCGRCGYKSPWFRCSHVPTYTEWHANSHRLPTNEWQTNGERYGGLCFSSARSDSPVPL